MLLCRQSALTEGPPLTTDPLFYWLFDTSPETFFLPWVFQPTRPRRRRRATNIWHLSYIETSHRTDDVFLPKESNLPLYFLEVQFYSRPSIFADLLAKVFTYLKQHNPAQDFRGVVLFAS
jgi:predicted transposase YdaD